MTAASSADGAGGLSTPPGLRNLSTNAGARSGRPELLKDLAAAVNALTRPNRVTEYVEVADVEEVVTRRGKRRKGKGRVRVRRAVHTTLPSLLDQLRTADPAAVESGARGAWSKGGFESKPPIELGTVSVLQEISDAAHRWALLLPDARTAGGVEDAMQSLVSARHTDTQLTVLAENADRWVRRARAALQLDPPPVTIGDPCPYCWRANCLVVAGDLSSAKCSRCGASWTHDTIGLLTAMLQANQQQATMTEAGAARLAAQTAAKERCWMSDCVRLGKHAQHEDDRGRTWGNTCEVTP